MALPSTKSQQAGGARFRQRKISVKQPLVIYKQKDLPDLSSNDLEPLQIHHLNLTGNAAQQRDVHAVETGVDKNEEDEVHLQQVINAAQRALRGSEEKKRAAEKEEGSAVKEEEKKPDVYIPTPDASKIWPEASKYYNDFSFVAPETYIKFSATVEDTVGVEYNMDEEDEEFLKNLNKDKSPTKTCSEIEFEIICDKLEKTIEERQPFLSMDPSNILTYKELSGFIIEEVTSNHNNGYGNGGKYILTTALKDKLSKELSYKPFVTLFDKRADDDDKPQPKTRSITKLFDLFGEYVYNHWKERKIVRHGKHIHPSLKFEDPNANEKENDADPYICFRRREFRQARKTRRADTLGAERIRLLQKSIHRAQELIELVCQREITRLDALDAEHEIFRVRAEGKALKRTIGIKGDDYLYYPHKRKKIIVKVEEEVTTENSTPVSKKQKKNKEQSGKDRKENEDATPMGGDVPTSAAAAAAAAAALQQEAATSSTQPYVKLPASKIPDMDLVTVSLVLKEKNETIKRAVLEKLRKRKEQDRHFINLTDDPYEPYFNISTNNHSNEVLELNHIPYSSITSSFYHEINNSNYISEELKNLLEDSKKALPGVKTFRGSNGELIPSKPFPHILSLMKQNDDEIAGDSNSDNGYIAQLFANIESNNFNSYNNGYGQQVRSQPENEENKLSEPIFRMRKRVGRAGRYFIDRKSLVKEQLPAAVEVGSSLLTTSSTGTSTRAVNVYDSDVDAQKRLESRWKFDNDLTEYDRGIQEPFSLDPSKLNCISDDTQSIRFGSMLLSKSYDLFRESVHQRQQVMIQQARARALQQQQLLQKQQQAAQAAQNAQQASQLQQQQQQAQKIQQQQQQNLLRQSGPPIPLLALSIHSQSHTPSHSRSPVTIPNSRLLPHGSQGARTAAPSQLSSISGSVANSVPRPSSQQRTNSNANTNVNANSGANQNVSNYQQQSRVSAQYPAGNSQQQNYKQSGSSPMYNKSSSK